MQKRLDERKNIFFDKVMKGGQYIKTQGFRVFLTSLTRKKLNKQEPKAREEK